MTKTYYGKRFDWPGTTVAYLCQTPWLFWDDLELQPLIASWFVQKHNRLPANYSFMYLWTTLKLLSNDSPAHVLNDTRLLSSVLHIYVQNESKLRMSWSHIWFQEWNWNKASWGATRLFGKDFQYALSDRWHTTSAEMTQSETLLQVYKLWSHIEKTCASLYTVAAPRKTCTSLYTVAAQQKTYATSINRLEACTGKDLSKSITCLDA